MKYQVLLDGKVQDGLFDDEDEAQEYGQYLSSCAREGAEILHMSNPGDYPYDEDEYEAPSWGVIEVED